MPHFQILILALLASVPTTLATENTGLNNLTTSNTALSNANVSSRNSYYDVGVSGYRPFIDQLMLGICKDHFGGWYPGHGSVRIFCWDPTHIFRGPGSYYFGIWNTADRDREMDPYGCETFMRKISDDCNCGGDFHLL